MLTNKSNIFVNVYLAVENFGFAFDNEGPIVPESQQDPVESRGTSCGRTDRETDLAFIMTLGRITNDEITCCHLGKIKAINSRG